MKLSITTLAAAATLALGGLAVAQSNPPTSTPGAGCTATANAMKGGNLGGSPSNIPCNGASTNTAAAVPAPAATQSAAVTSTPPQSTSMGNTGAMADSSTTGNSTPTRTRVARADRN